MQYAKEICLKEKYAMYKASMYRVMVECEVDAEFNTSSSAKTQLDDQFWHRSRSRLRERCARMLLESVVQRCEPADCAPLLQKV